MFDIYILLIGAIILLEFLLFRYALKRNLRQGTYLNIFYLSYYIFQGVLSCLIFYLDKDFLLANTNSRVSIPLRDSILPYCIGTLLAIIGILIGMIISNKISWNNNKMQWYERIIVLEQMYNINRFSLFLTIGFSFSILVSLIPSYLISAISLTFAFSPLMVGVIWSSLTHGARTVWKFVLFITFLFHTLQGSRGLAIFPLAAFAIGYLFSISCNRTKLKKTIRIYVVIILISIPFLSFVQTYREIFGRGNEISLQTFTEMLNFAATNQTSDNEKNIYASYGRLLNHTNNVVVVMTPSIVPFRGFDAMEEEIASIFKILGQDNAQEFRKERSELGYSTGVATRYGFRVTEETSVEFGMFADAYSRFGYLGIFIYSLIFAIILALMEKWCFNHSFNSPLLSTVLLIFLLYNGALNYMYSYYSFFKIILIRGAMVIMCTKFFALFCTKRL